MVDSALRSTNASAMQSARCATDSAMQSTMGSARVATRSPGKGTLAHPSEYPWAHQSNLRAAHIIPNQAIGTMWKPDRNIEQQPTENNSSQTRTNGDASTTNGTGDSKSFFLVYDWRDGRPTKLGPILADRFCFN